MIDSKQHYKSVYSPFGVMIPSPMVAEVLENKHGIINPVIDLNTGANTTTTTPGTVLPIVSGTIDDSNVTFDFGQKPSLVVENGSTYRENHGWTWSGTAVVLDSPPGTGGDVFALS